MKHKYVIIDYGTPVVFPDTIQHNMIKGNITSAGFYHIEDGEVFVYGFSQSLKIKFEPDDAVILAKFLNMVPLLDSVPDIVVDFFDNFMAYKNAELLVCCEAAKAGWAKDKVQDLEKEISV